MRDRVGEPLGGVEPGVARAQPALAVEQRDRRQAVDAEPIRDVVAIERKGQARVHGVLRRERARLVQRVAVAPVLGHQTTTRGSER